MWYANVVACQLYLLCALYKKNTQLNNRFYLVKWSHNFFSFFSEKSKTKTKIFKTKLKLSTQCFNFSTWHESVQQISFFRVSLAISLCLPSFVSLYFCPFFSRDFFHSTYGNWFNLMSLDVNFCCRSLEHCIHFNQFFKSFNSFVFLCTHCHTNL